MAEFLVIFGVFWSNSLVGMLAAIGTIFGAAYNVWLYNRVFFGPMNNYLCAFGDLNNREILLLTPVIFLMLLMGIFPSLFLDLVHVSVLAEVASAVAI